MRMTTRLLTTAAIALLVALIPGTSADVRAQAPSGPREGIVVHGHWTIDIREPDGRIVSHREFENALVSSGGSLLADILARRRAAGAWKVSLGGSPANAGPCTTSSGTAEDCALLEPGWFASLVGFPVFRNLVVGPTGFVLSGTATAGKAGSIDHVSTSSLSCTSDVLPSVCSIDTSSNATQAIFSATTLTPPQAVSAGQLIQVTVTFTFS
jgi:hypothetical protein